MSKKRISKVSRTDWARVRALTDEAVDFTEIPEVRREQLARAKLRIGLEPVPRGKTRVTILLNNAIVQYFKAMAGGRGYQTLINESLAEYIRTRDVEVMLRRVIREEMKGTG